MASLLVDEGISRDLVQALVAQGCRAIHRLDIGRKGAHDASVFLAAQQRSLTLFTHNRDDYVFLVSTWAIWGHGDHQGIIAPRKHKTQLTPPQLFPVMLRFCQDTSSFLNRIELF